MFISFKYRGEEENKSRFVAIRKYLMPPRTKLAHCILSVLCLL